MDLGYEDGWHGEHEALHQHAWAWALTQAHICHHGQAQDFISFTACLSTWVSFSEEASTTGDTMERGAVAAVRRHPEDVSAMAAGASACMGGVGDDGDELQVEWWIREMEPGKTLA